MRNFFILLFFLLNTYLVAQVNPCTFTNSVSQVYYPNTNFTQTMTYTYICGYLCSPNAAVVDTGVGCKVYYVNASCSLTIRPGFCGAISTVYLKNNATVNLLPGGAGMVNIFYEPLAVINNTASIYYGGDTCSLIIFPFVSCSTGVNEETENQKSLKIWPNPASSKVNIELDDLKGEFIAITITNQLGIIVYENRKWSKKDKEIYCDSFSNGLYYLQIKTENSLITEKLLINH